MKAILVQETGGAEKLCYEEIQIPEPGAGQARVRIHAIGVNFIDVYHRTGLYQTPLPHVPGVEAAGIVDAVGDDVTEVKPGDHVAYAMNPGAYAEYALAKSWQLVKLPEGIDFRTAAAAMLQGMTAHYLAFSAFPLKEGQTALVHAAAGGVGRLLVQMARMTGARVIGTASTEEKAEAARRAGAGDVILYEKENFETAVRRLTADRGVDVVYDSVGRATFDRGLNCLRLRGTMVLFGQSSGPVPPLDLSLLNAKGSLFVTRPSLVHYVSTPAELNRRAGDLFKWVAEGRLEVRVDRALPLRDAAEAHRALEGRKTIGKILLIP